MNKGFVVTGLVLLIVGAFLDVSLFRITSSAFSETILSVEPEIKSVGLGEVFTVSIRIVNANNLMRWLFSINWNNTVIGLNPESSDALVEGSFLKSMGPTFFYRPSCRTGISRISSISCEFSPPSRVSGEGVLMTISFKAIGNGRSNVTICDAFLDTSQGKATPTCRDGVVVVGSDSPLPAHDLAAMLDPPKNVFVNEETRLVAFVENVGTMDEFYCNVTFMVDTFIAGVTRVDYLQAYASPCVASVNWTPTNEGSHVLSVYVSPAVGETGLENNFDSTSFYVSTRYHDVSVHLDCPNRTSLPGITLLNITTNNEGGFEETVEVTLTIEGPGTIVAERWNVTNLSLSAPNLTTYSWTPKFEGNYSIQVWAHIDTNDVDATNNNDTSIIDVVKNEMNRSADILIVADIGGLYPQRGTSLTEFESALEKAGYGYDVWFESYSSVNGSAINASILQAYKLVIYTCGDYGDRLIDQYVEEPAIMSYIRSGGSILVEGEKIANYLTARGRPELLESVFCVKLTRTSVQTSGLEHSKPHMITQDLPGSIDWVRAPTRGLDGLTPINQGFQVIRYAGTNLSAVTVVDKSETGTGDAVYYSFSLFSLPEDFRQRLVSNTVKWFLRNGVSYVLGEIIHSPQNSVRFLYSSQEAEYGFATGLLTGSMLYSLCSSEQQQSFADNVNSLEITERLVCISGDLGTNYLAKTYNDSGMLPIIIHQDQNKPQSYSLVDKARNLTWIVEPDSCLNHTFLIQAFSDANSAQTCLLATGFFQGWDWAAGICLSRIISGNLRDYCSTYYIFTWQDVNGDLIPQVEFPQEISVLAVG